MGAASAGCEGLDFRDKLGISIKIHKWRVSVVWPNEREGQSYACVRLESALMAGKERRAIQNCRGIEKMECLLHIKKNNGIWHPTR